MIQDIKGHYHNEYMECEPEQNDYIMFVSGRKVLLKIEQEEIKYATYGELREYFDKDTFSFIYLFNIEIDGAIRKFFLCRGNNLPDTLLEGYTYENQNIFRKAMPKDLAFAGVTACQLANWYDNTQYCGHCGTRLVHDHKERMMKCPACNAVHYPKLSPAVIIAVTDGDRILMTRYAGRDYKSYALVAGFTEIGETLEETVQREVMEEVGLHVKNIRYYKSQPWSFTDTMLMGFFCELDGSDKITMDELELSSAQWVKREDIWVELDDISLTNEMIVTFKCQK